MGFKARRGRTTVAPELDALFERGWPYLRVLTDEEVSARVARGKAKKALQAIDPYLPARVPRDVARRYLRGYKIGDPYKEQAALEAAVADDVAPIDRAWLDEILREKMGPSAAHGKGTETYLFRLAEIVFLFEAFLGTKVVVGALVSHLVAARDNPAWWGTPYFQDHENGTARRLVPILGWLRLRMDAETWRRAVRPLAGVQPALPNYVANLGALLDDGCPLDGVTAPEWIAMQRRDKVWLDAYLDRRKAWGYWADPQLYYVVGVSALDDQPMARLTRQPRWVQERVVDEFGALRAPQVARVIRVLSESRSKSVREAAARWLAEQGQGAVELKEAKTSDELEAELRAMLEGVGARLVAQGGDPVAERQVLDESFAIYCELRAALEDPTPEAYFTHSLGDVCETWEADEATTQRWLDLAIEAAGG